MFSAKLFTIVSAVLAVAVNGSPVEAARDEPKSVRCPRGLFDADPCADVDDGEIQTLMVLPIQQALGNVNFCIDGGACKQVSVDSNVCTNMPNDFDKKISSFHPDKNFVCTLFEYVNSPATMEKRII